MPGPGSVTQSWRLETAPRTAAGPSRARAPMGSTLAEMRAAVCDVLHTRHPGVQDYSQAPLPLQSNRRARRCGERLPCSMPPILARVGEAHVRLLEISVDVEHELHRAVAGGDLGLHGDGAADVEGEHGVVRPRLVGRVPVDVADLGDTAGPDAHESRAAAAGDRDVGRD